jgi:hypothetical protein
MFMNLKAVLKYRHTRPGALNWPLSEKEEWQQATGTKTIQTDHLDVLSSLCGIKIPKC